MKEKDEKENFNDLEDSKDEIDLENTTKYGEFISSYFAWVPLEKQKEKADKLNKMTKDR